MIPHNFVTHKAAWRTALFLAYQNATHPDDKSYWEHEIKAYDEAHVNLEAGIWNCYVGDMVTSAGTDYYVCIEAKEDAGKKFFDRERMTPHMFKERWKAEYEVATWNAFLNGGEEPDILAYGP